MPDKQRTLALLTGLLLAALASGCSATAYNVELEAPEFLSAVAVSEDQKVGGENRSGIVNGYQWQTNDAVFEDASRLEQAERAGAYGELRATRLTPGATLDQYMEGFGDIAGVRERTLQESPLNAMEVVETRTGMMGGEEARIVIYEGRSSSAESQVQPYVEQNQVDESTAEDIIVRRIIQANVVKEGYGYTLIFSCTRAMWSEWGDAFQDTIDSVQFVQQE